MSAAAGSGAPAIGICAAVEKVSWGVWDGYEVTLAPRAYVRCVQRAGGTAIAWGHDNRTCSMRVVGHGEGLRVENRLPGADVNPYLALAAMIAAGLHGIDNELPLEEVFEGNAYESDKPRVPSNIYDARDAFAASAVAKKAFGQEVVDHYLNNADVELRAFEAAVTDWERFRGFERL